MCGGFLFGQTELDLEGEYYFKNNSATIFIFNKTKFLAVGYATAILGNVEVIDNAIYFKPDHPNSEILLYGRKNIKKKQIIFNEYFFRNKLYFGALSDQKNREPLNLLYKDNDYCASKKYVIPFKINPEKVFIKTSSDDLLTSFSIYNDYDEFLPVYLEKDSDISFLDGVITIENSQIMFDETVKRKPLNITNEIKEIIKDLEKIDSLFEKDFIYLDSDYTIISTGEIDLSNNYSYNKLKNEYNRKTKLSEKNLNTLYQFNKIKGTAVSMEEYKFYDTNLIAKCLKTPSTIVKEKEDKRYNESNPTKTAEVQSMPYIK